uniref:Putative ribonuclease H-like domain-containing protein n=1 Tax=Tanacetum cinerariifolium TaxID=118510 RepID=A0A699GYV5_TANCI|nr:putative ribonuclease H-like domain-containing protein [Tanacetum cinerariifolium]
MSRDVITVGSTMRISLLYRGEYSQWRERFMDYLEEQMHSEAMINSIQNDNQPLPVIAQVSLAGTAQNAPPTLKDLKFWTAEEKKTQKIDRLAISLLIQGILNDIYSLIDSNETAKDLWDALERQMRGFEYAKQDRKAAILYEYETFKATEGDANDGLGYKKKAVMITLDPLALVAEKMKITTLLAKDFNRRKFYSKPTNNNLRTSSISQSANKKQEFVKSDDKKVEKKADEKKRDMSKDQAWIESNSDSDQEINANMVFMAQIEKEERYEYMIRYSALYDNDKKHRKKIDEQEILFDKMSCQLVEMNNNVLRLQEKILEKETEISELEGCVSNKDVEIEKCLERLNECFENPSNFEKAKDLRPSLYDEKVIGLGYTPMFLIHSDEALEIEKFKRARENKIEFAYDYENLNASYVNEKINFLDDYFQEIINPDFEKIDSPFQQTSSHKPYVSNVILEKIIIDLEDEVVNLLEKEKANLETIESLKSKDVKRYSRKDLLSCNNSHIGETSSAYVCNDAMNVSCNSRLCDSFDENNLFIFDDESVRISPISKMPFRRKPCDSMNICLWIIDSGCSKHMTGNRAMLTNFVEKFLGMVRFGNNDFTVIAGYGDVVIGSMKIKKVYYVEGLGHNLFSVGQFYDKGLEVAFRKSTCFVRNEHGVDLLTGDRSSNLYTIALNEVASNSSTFLLAKASSSQSWLWHQCLCHLNFATINNLVKNNLVQGLPKMKFEKDHLCSSCEQGKIHRKHHKSKTAFASNKTLYLLHMDLCGPMCVESINRKRYVLVVVDDYSRYTWVFFLHSKDEASEVIISFIKKTQANLQLQVQRVRTDNGTEFKNKTLAKFFDEAEAIAIACFAQNRSIIHKRFDRTPYELMNKRKQNIKFFQSAAFKIYNKRTPKIHESVNVNFDEILEMASKQFSLEPGLSNLNETRKSSNPSVSQVSKTSKKDLEDLFQKFYGEYFDSSKIMKSSTTNVETSNVKVPSHEEEVFHESFESFQEKSSSSSLNDDVQQSVEEVGVPLSNTQSVSNNMIPNVDKASTSHNVFNERLEDAYFDVSTSFHDPSNVHTFYQPYPHEKKWTKDHLLHKIIGDPKSSVRTIGQLGNSCLFSCLLSSIEPANVVEALKDADWVSAMQEELDQFARLKDFTVFQIDIKTSFLNGILKEKVYVGQPLGFVSKQYPDHVYALDKALFGMKNCDIVPTPMVEQAKLKLDLVGKPVDHTDYQSMIRSLMYVTSSRTDIMFATCMYARYQENPNEHHVSAVKRIFHYLKGSINLGLWYPKDSGFDLTAYLNTDHAGCHLDRKNDYYIKRKEGRQQTYTRQYSLWSSRDTKNTFVHALAREINVSFFPVLARDIESGDVRIERLFDEARACSPSIVYIIFVEDIAKRGNCKSSEALVLVCMI